MSKKVDNTKLILIIAIVVVVVIVVYIISFGQINVANGNPFPQEFKDSKEEAKRKHEELKLQIEADEILYKKLQNRFSLIYFFVRLGFIMLWVGLILLLYKMHLVTDVSSAIDYSQATLLIFIVLNFLTFGSITNLNIFLSSFKTKLENWVWRKNKELNSRLEANKSEAKKLERFISSDDNDLEKLN